MSDYETWVANKGRSVEHGGIIDGDDVGDYLFPYQADLTRWALRRGRAALFADTGLGKTAMQLAWAHRVSVLGRVLILAPLAVGPQTVAEGRRFGVPCAFVHGDDDGSQRIVVANYEMLHRLEPSSFVGVVLDESSILKAYDGKTRAAIIEAFGATPYRLACTATPAPNDYTELGNHTEFLGVKPRMEMLAEYFVHDGGATQDWRLKGHAEDVFWRWVASWGAMLKAPSDLGYSDDGFALPPLRMHEHVIPVEHREAWSEGFLFAPEARSLADARVLRRATMSKRVSKVAELVDNERPAIVWCELNAEGDALEQAIPGAVQVKGADDNERKASALEAFAAGEVRVLITKPTIAGFGLNWQHCANVVFVGASYSYEQTYQAIRRCWRFGQKRPVDVHVLRAETEDRVVAAYRRKEADAERLSAEMREHVRAAMRDEICGARREWNDYQPRAVMAIPPWLRSETCTF